MNWVKARSATEMPYIVLDAIHAVEPESDGCVEQIAKKAQEALGCHVIIGTRSRLEADLNRVRSDRNGNVQAVDEYRTTLRSMLAASGVLDRNGKAKRPILHVAIHGMKDRGWAIEIGTSPTGKESASRSARRWFFEATQEWCGVNPIAGVPMDKVYLNQMFSGDPSITCHRHGDPIPAAGYDGFGKHYHHFQVEFTAEWRENYTDKAVRYVIDMVQQFAVATMATPTCFDCDKADEYDDIMQIDPLDDKWWGDDQCGPDGLPMGFFLEEEDINDRYENEWWDEDIDPYGEYIDDPEQAALLEWIRENSNTRRAAQ